jgi:hypothetical protein
MQAEPGPTAHLPPTLIMSSACAWPPTRPRWRAALAALAFSRSSSSRRAASRLPSCCCICESAGAGRYVSHWLMFPFLEMPL